MAAFVFQTGLLRDAAAGDVGYAAVPLSRIHGDPGERALRAAGVDVRLGWRAERVRARADGGFSVDGRGEAIECEAAIVALPHARAAGVLPEGAIDDPSRLERLGTSPIVNLHVVYDRPVTDHAVFAAVRSPVQWGFDRTRVAGLDRGQYLGISISGARREIGMSRDELRAAYLPALADLFPRAKDASVERFEITREHAATFRAGPGAARLRPGPRTRLDGLALAGSWTATGWPATMEGAVRSGMAAAREVLETARPAARPTEAIA
jgi:monoamine oxidase